MDTLVGSRQAGRGGRAGASGPRRAPDEAAGPTAAPIELDPVRCHRALRGRDARFDGRFYVGVVTTGIFCRPVCPAPTPRPAHCSWWPSAAAAQAAGFRPCLRCRPEAAPGSPAWRGTAATVTRALRLIEAGALDHGDSVEGLAARLGIGDRHLRRLFERHLGTTPLAVAKLRRALFAKRLLDETTLPMTAIARSAGFSSQRRFNACMREVYGRPPSALRSPRARRPSRRGRAGTPEPTAECAIRPLELTLAYRPPFAWDQLLAFLALRATPGVEAVRGRAYARSIRLGASSGSILAVDDPARRRLCVTIRLASTESLVVASARLRTLFDLDADPAAIDGVLGGLPPLAESVRRAPGLRVPGAFDGFETAVRAVLGQQVSVVAATTFAGRLVARWGTSLEAGLRPAFDDAPQAEPPAAIDRLFPTAEGLAGAPLEEIGLVRGRADTIRALARAVLDDPSLLEPAQDLEAALARWRALPGIGSWTAGYVAMRVLREPDALPEADRVLRRALTPVGAERLVPGRAVARMLEGARPYRAYAAIRLWESCSPGK